MPTFQPVEKKALVNPIISHDLTKAHMAVRERLQNMKNIFDKEDQQTKETEPDGDD